MDSLLSDVQDLFREVFDDGELVVSAQTTAADIEGWDSLMHINIIIAMEQHFGVRFATAEISGLKNEGENVGSMLRMVERKMASA